MKFSISLLAPLVILASMGACVYRMPGEDDICTAAYHRSDRSDPESPPREAYNLVDAVSLALEEVLELVLEPRATDPNKGFLSINNE